MIARPPRRPSYRALPPPVALALTLAGASLTGCSDDGADPTPDAAADAAAAADGGPDAAAPDAAGAADAAGGAEAGGSAPGPDAGRVDAGSEDARPAPEAGAGTDAGPAADGATSGLVVTSSAFAEGETIPAAHTCAGANTSPALAFSAGPPGTQSYAVVLQDQTSPNRIVHWVVWDIPAAARGLPAAVPGGMTLVVPAGAKQAAYDDGVAYFGPCPQGPVHTYRFTVYALGVAALPGGSAGKTTKTVPAMIEAAGQPLATGTLTGTSGARRP